MERKILREGEGRGGNLTLERGGAFVMSSTIIINEIISTQG